MISIVKTDKIRTNKNVSENEGEFVIVEMRGLSTDIKPTEFDGRNIDNGSIFVEIDTGSIYFYDLDSKQWMEA